MALTITLTGDVTIGDSTSTEPARRLPGSRDRVALAMLVVERHRGVSRDALAEAVWPEGLPTTWASALRNVVSRVRSFVTTALEHGQLPAGELITATEGSRYHLHLPHDAEVDVERAEEALGLARESLNLGHPLRAHELAHKAAACLGSPFLPEQDGEWATTQRERYGELHITALELASQAALDQGDATAALTAAQDAITHAPLRESAHRLAMAAHSVAGNRAEALAIYQRLRRRLAEELGVDPMPETEAAYVDVLGWAETSPSDRKPTPSLDMTSGRPRPAPFVARAGELERLTAAWTGTTSSRRARVALVLGEAGIGKSRLVGEAARSVAADGGLVLFGRCEADSGIPFQPLTEVLENLVSVLPDDELPPLDPAAMRELATAFPRAEWTGPALARAPGDEPVDRARLSAAVAGLIRGVAQRRPLFVVLDDLQWIEADTVVVLLHLIAELHDTPLLAVAVVRDPPTPSDMFHATLHNLERTIDVERIELDGLDEEAIRQIVAALHPEAGPQTAAVSRRLWTATAGNPFMLLELLGQEQSLDDIAGGLNRTGAVPHGIADLVEAKLRALDPSGRDLLRAAAVVGRAFDMDVAVHAAGLDTLAALDGLDTALDAGLVSEVAPDRYRFTHDVVQRTLYDQLSGTRRRTLHARCADAIEELRADHLDPETGGPYTPAMARHCLAATATRADRRAVRWASLAARQALGGGAFAEAQRLYAAALDHVPDTDDRLRADVATALGLVHHELNHPQAERTLLDAALAAQSCGHRAAAARAALALADRARHQPDLRGRTVALLAELAAHPPAPADGTNGEAADDEDAVLWARVVARSTTLSDTRPDVAPGPPGPSPERDAALALARHLAQVEGPGRLTERRTLADELSTLARAANHEPSRLAADHNLAMVAALWGDDDEVEARLPRPGPQAAASTVALWDERAVAVAVSEGRFDDARARATRLCPPPSSGTDTDAGADGEADIAAHAHVRSEPDTDGPTGEDDDLLGLLSTGAPPGSMACRQLVVADWLQGRLHQRLDVGSDLHPTEQALAHMAVGEPGRAHLLIRTLLADGSMHTSIGDDWLHDVGLVALSVARLDDPTTAATIQAMLAPYAELSCGMGYRSFVGTVRFHLGCLAAATGEWADAERNLMAALADSARRGARPWDALARVALADVLDARGRPSDRELATRLRTEAHGIARRLPLAVPPFV